MKATTERLYIRPLYESDWQEIKNIFTDFSKSPYAIYDMPLPTENEGAKALAKTFAESNSFFAVFLKETKKMIGYVCFHKDGDRYDLGYCFHSAHHAKGYAYESVTVLIQYFIDQCGAVFLPQVLRSTICLPAGC